MRQIISLAALLSLVCVVSAQTGSPFGTPKATQPAPKEKSGLEKAIEDADAP